MRNLPDSSGWLEKRAKKIIRNTVITAPKKIISLHEGCDRNPYLDPPYQIRHDANSKSIFCMRCGKKIMTDIPGTSRQRPIINRASNIHGLAGW